MWERRLFLTMAPALLSCPPAHNLHFCNCFVILGGTRCKLDMRQIENDITAQNMAKDKNIVSTIYIQQQFSRNFMAFKHFFWLKPACEFDRFILKERVNMHKLFICICLRCDSCCFSQLEERY